jgi:hypothetical protein
MTLSASSRVSKSSSAATIAPDRMIVHLNPDPANGAMAFSMSAADVPGAKFSATTTQGPARPRIEKDFFDVLTTLT